MSITNTSNSHSDVDVMMAELLLCFAPSPSHRVKAGKTAGAVCGESRDCHNHITVAAAFSPFSLPHCFASSHPLI